MDAITVPVPAPSLRTVRNLLGWTLVLLLAWCAGDVPAQVAPAAQRESALRAAFLYRFSLFTDWPEDALPQGQPFTIAVLGDPEVAQDLTLVTNGRSIRGRPVRVRQVSAPAQAAGAQMLFIGETPADRWDALVDALPRGPMLVVSAQPQGHPPGSALNFERDGGRVRFTAAPAAAEQRGLRLSARLLGVARRVEGREP